ncbi:hypothetical protein Tco_0500964 [Tanacetum coccineum]
MMRYLVKKSMGVQLIMVTIHDERQSKDYESQQLMIRVTSIICRRLGKGSLLVFLRLQLLPADDPDSAGGCYGLCWFTPYDWSFTICRFCAAVVLHLSLIIAGGALHSTNVSTDSNYQLLVLWFFESTSGDINEFFLESDEEEQIGMSRVVADPDSDDEVLAEIIFRGVKVKPLSGLPLLSSSWSRSSESESDDDMENYIPPLPYGEFKDWEIVSCPPGSPSFATGGWNSSVHVLDLTNGKTVYMFVDKFYPIRATLLERMLRHRLTVPPSYCRDVVVAGNIIQTVQAGLRQAYESIASAPISPWLTAKKESGSPLQTALVCNSNPLMVASCFPFDAAILDVASTVSAACIVAAGYIVSVGICDAAGIIEHDSVVSAVRDVRFDDGITWFCGLGGLFSRAVGFLRGTSVVIVILVKGHAFPTIVKVNDRRSPEWLDPL